MIWFNIRKLESQISANELSDKDAFNYVLAFFILSCFSLGAGSSTESGWFRLVNVILSVVVTIWGLKGAYDANEEVDGKDFLKRFFAINWVVGMRMLFILIGLSLVIGIIAGLSSVTGNTHHTDSSQFMEWFMVVFLLLFQVVYFSLVIKSIGRLEPVSE